MNEPISGLWIDDDELLTAALGELDIILPEICEEIHDAGHCLRVWLLSFSGGNHLLDRSAIDNGANEESASTVA